MADLRKLINGTLLWKAMGLTDAEPKGLYVTFHTNENRTDFALTQRHSRDSHGAPKAKGERGTREAERSHVLGLALGTDTGWV